MCPRIALNWGATSQKRREDACPLPKLRETERLLHLAKQALEMVEHLPAQPPFSTASAS